MRGGPIFSVWRATLLAFVLLSIGHRDARAQDSLESAVKATFLSRFGSFADWPADAFADETAPLVICVAGDPAFAQLVENSARGERAAGRALAVRHITVVAPENGCHILYLAFDSAQQTRDALQATQGDSTLTVTDVRFTAVRGAIHFVRSDGRVRFHIDRAAAARNRINLSSRLLNIALTVSGASG